MSDYALALAAAAVVGLFVARRLTGAPWLRLIDLHLGVAVAAVVVGRVGFAVVNAEWFAEHPAVLVDFAAAPGLHGLSALAGAAVVALATRRQRAVAFTMCLVGVAASLNCIGLGCGAGREVFWTDGALLWLLRVDWPDAMGVRNPRLPTQLFAAAWLAACAVLSLRRPAWALAAAVFGEGVLGLLRV
jgi:hypothetical protein